MSDIKNKLDTVAKKFKRFTKKVDKKIKEEKKEFNIKKIFPKKIDNMKVGLWILITVIYTLFIGIFSGWISTSLSEIIYIGKVPIDTRTAVLAFGLAMWVFVSMMIQNIARISEKVKKKEMKTEKKGKKKNGDV